MKFALIFLLLCNCAFAASNGKFITLDSGDRLFVDYKEPKGDSPTIVLLHGLTYSNKSWDAFVDGLSAINSDVGILRYDMKGMGETLLDRSLPVNYPIPYEDQVKDLSLLLKKLQLKKVHLLGLSYGGGIGIAFANQYPEMIHSLILMAPFTEPVKQQDEWIKLQVSVARASNPWNPATDDELYDFFLRQFVYSTYPSAEPTILENPYKLEAVYRMAQGVRKLLAKEHVKNLPAGSVHLMVANEDQYIPKTILDSFWKNIPKEKRASRILISTTEHKMPEAIPLFSSSWVNEILKGNEKISEGKSFEGSTLKQNAKSGSTVIDLSR